jgi:hypothetical protein
MVAALITGIVAIIFLCAVLAPLESLGWWAGWYGPSPATSTQQADAPQPGDASQAFADHYLVFLSGIGAISGTSLPPDEIRFLDALEARLDHTALIRDVFPYSVTNNGLNGQRFFALFWRWIERMRLKRPEGMLAGVICLRNMFQVGRSTTWALRAKLWLGCGAAAIWMASPSRCWAGAAGARSRWVPRLSLTACSEHRSA